MILRLLQPADDRSEFSSGDAASDEFLRSYAGQNQFKHRISNTLVIVHDEQVLAYATFAVGEISRDEMGGTAARLPRYPLPALRLSRLAVDEHVQGVGLGTLLVREVLRIALRLRVEYGCAAVLVDARTEAVGFYEALGFAAVKTVVGRGGIRGTVMMVLPLAEVSAALDDGEDSDG